MALHDLIRVSKIDEVYMMLQCEKSTAQEICDLFTYLVPGHEYMPPYKKKLWDGKIRLFQLRERKLYIGLLPYLEKFCKSRNYGIEVASDVYRRNNINLDDLYAFITELDIPYEIRDYQLDGILYVLNHKRCVLVSPTASGKSLIIYVLLRCFFKNIDKILIIVPTTNLVEQMYKDFSEYGFDSDKFVHRIYQGQEKQTDKRVVISTWQSLYKMDKEYFKDFGAVIGDEAHQFKAKSLTAIMTKLSNAEYRVGTTGTLDGLETSQMVLEGLFGLAHQVTTTKELIDTEVLADLDIHCIVLRHNMENSETVSYLDYKGEIDFLVSSEDRNKFMVEMISLLSGNTLVLYQLVEKHGEMLYDMMKTTLPDKKIRFVHGKVKTDVREVIRETAEKVNDLVIVASYGTFSTGINIKNLHNIVFASPSKSQIRVLQSIGRGLRRSENKNKIKLFDISDDLTIGDYTNYTYRHLLSRLQIYNDEKFKYKLKTFNLLGK